jgi:NAD(P)-dependent dehydrogenase (short-subunit alcohol dehydrogenase family)
MVQKSILVTGGGQGIGKATCRFLLNSGYKVFTIDNDDVALKELKEELPQIETFNGDIGFENDIKEFVIKSGKNGVFGLVNNAAIGINKFPGELSIDEWNRVIAVNLTGPFLISKYCFSYLKQSKGSIVNIASTRAFMSEPNTEAYSASKGGIVSLTHSLAISFAPFIRVNCISPGWIEVGNLKRKSDQLEIQHTEADRSQHPVGRVGIPEDICNMIAYLLSDKSGFISGQNFIIDGGMTKKMIYV